MVAFGSGLSAASSAAMAAREAARGALAHLKGTTPKLAIVFASPSYADVDQAARAVRDVIGDAQIIGGTSAGCVCEGDQIAKVGVSVVLLGGADIEVESRVAALGSASYVEVVPVAERIARAADAAAAKGLPNFACLVLAPAYGMDGEALVAAVRKGAGAHAQLAGAITGNDLGIEPPRVFFGDELRSDVVVVTGLYTKQPVGIAARHGWSPTGPIHTVTRAEGTHLVELDGRPTIEVWLEDVRAAGGDPPSEPELVVRYLEHHYPIGIVPDANRAHANGELVARAPASLRPNGAVRMSASIAEGTRVQIIEASRENLLRASHGAAADAALRVGEGPVVGALVLTCSARLAVLGDAFAQEPAEITRTLGAPIGGVCVWGEIARNLRDSDAFFNTTVVVMAFG